MELISSAPANRVSGNRRRGISRRGFGFAYQLTPKLVARGGYGIFYGGFENSVIETYVDFPFQYTLGYSYQVPNAPITFNNGSIGTLETGITGIPLTPAAVEPGGVSFTGEDYHMQTPYTQGYNLTVQYELSPNDTVQLGYVGNTVHHMGTYVNPNTPREILPPGLNALSYSPYPDFSSYMVYSTFSGNSHYNSLQANYERRVGHGLSVLGNFTWASCMNDAVDVLNPTALGPATALRSCRILGYTGTSHVAISTLTKWSTSAEYMNCHSGMAGIFWAAAAACSTRSWAVGTPTGS